VSRPEDQARAEIDRRLRQASGRIRLNADNERVANE
jgi:hypothetical protein